MAEPTTPRRGLGRGLSALMADLGSDLSRERHQDRPDPGPAPDRMLPIGALTANPDQPRRYFAEEGLDELAASIRTKGIIQPLIARPDPADPTRYQIVAGERRWRAAQRAGLTELPVILRDYDDTELLEIAIIENVQRADLNPIDEGSAYRQLMDRFGHTQEQVAVALGKSRSHVANQMRLLGLPDDVQAMVADQRLTAGHARPLIGHPDASALARRIVERRLSAREAEALSKGPMKPPVKRPGLEKDDDTRAIEGELSAVLRMGVRIDHAAPGEGGRMTITFRSLEQLDDLLGRLSGS